MSLFYQTTRILLRGYFHLFYRFSISGDQTVLPGKAILAPNHASFLDPPIIGAAWHEDVHYLARASLFRNRLLGWLLIKLHAHPIHGNANDIDSIRLICQLLNEGNKVVIFPEGERSSSGDLQTIKSGIAMIALRTQAPIIPIYISGTFEAWPRHRKRPKVGTTIVCVFGKPIFPDISGEGNKRQAQEQLTQKVQMGLEELRLMVEEGK
jgi:1-acyl-sn-glycerol-3-phosphate acyltransferase